MDPFHDTAWQAIPKAKQWKYAYCERERRFLLSGLPKEPMAKPTLKLRDKYFHGTQMRLRQADNGSSIEYKIQKKLRLEVGQTDQLWNSTIYLDEAEYNLYLPLPGIFLVKRRSFFEGPIGEEIGVDQIELSGKTLFIAEIEFKSEEEMQAYVYPWEFVEEITNIAGWSSFDLATRIAKQS